MQLQSKAVKCFALKAASNKCHHDQNMQQKFVLNMTSSRNRSCEISQIGNTFFSLGLGQFDDKVFCENVQLIKNFRLKSRKSWLHKYLLHHDLQIFIQGRVMLKNNSIYFLIICVNFPCKIEKLNLEVVCVCVGTLGTRICFQGSHELILLENCS